MQIEIKNRRTYSGPGVYVGRPSPLGNPFVARRHDVLDGLSTRTREEAITRFAEEFRNQVRRWDAADQAQCAPAVAHAVSDLVARVRRGEHVTLICWCTPKPCHAEVIRDVIMEIVARQTTRGRDAR